MLTTKGIKDLWFLEEDRTDYYPFGWAMPGRKYAPDEYRYGFNGMEKDDEVKNSEGSHYTTMFRQYDPRVARWMSIDPEVANLPHQSPYNGFDLNPIALSDPLGNCTHPNCPAEGEFKDEDGGKINYSGDDGFTVGQLKDDWGISPAWKETRSDLVENVPYQLEAALNKVVAFSETLEPEDFNPIESSELYLGGYVKIEKEIIGDLKVVIPYAGGQVGYQSNKGGYNEIILADKWYVNAKVGAADVKLYPSNGLARGDYDPGLRFLYTMYSKPITVPVGGVPVPIGEIKVQGDASYNSSSNSSKFGVRGVAETFSLPTLKKGEGIKLEINGGMKLKLQVPNVINKGINYDW